MGDREDDVIARRNARESGLPTYQNKRPCRSGHQRPIRSTKTGLCLLCSQIYYQKHKRRILAGNKKSRAKRIDRIRKYRARIRATEGWKEAYNEYCRRWRKLNRERTTRYRKNFRSKNRERTNTYTRNRRARLKQAVGEFTVNDILRIYKMQRGRCAYCRERLNKHYEIDHIIPLSKGGTNWPNNLQLLCSRTLGKACNQAKNAKDPMEYARSLGQLL